MTELTSFMLERLWEDGELVLFRGMRDDGLARVLVVAPALEQPVPEPLRDFITRIRSPRRWIPLGRLAPWSWYITKGGRRL